MLSINAQKQTVTGVFGAKLVPIIELNGFKDRILSTDTAFLAPKQRKESINPRFPTLTGGSNVRI